MYVFISYKQQQAPDHEFAAYLETRLAADGHCIFRDENCLNPSDTWAQRLYDEIHKCDTLVAIVSNSALKSTWCLNEVDLARKLDKRIVPILVETIDEALEFQAFSPRFMLTHWYRATGDFSRDAEAIAAVLKEDADMSYERLLEITCDKHGIKDPTELFEALMRILQITHTSAAIGSDLYYCDGMEGLIGPVRSVAESIQRLCQANSWMMKHNARVQLKSGKPNQSKQQVWIAQRCACLGDLLVQSIDLWDRQGKLRREQIDRFTRKMRESDRDETAT